MFVPMFINLDFKCQQGMNNSVAYSVVTFNFLFTLQSSSINQAAVFLFHNHHFFSLQSLRFYNIYIFLFHYVKLSFVFFTLRPL